MKKVVWVLATGAILLATRVALGVEVEGSPAKLVNDLDFAVKAGGTREIIAAAITLVLFLWRRYASGFLLDKVPTRFLPLVAAGLGFLASIPAGLTGWGTGYSFGRFVLTAIVLSAEATFFWAALGKFVLPKVFGEPVNVADKPSGPHGFTQTPPR